jgi:uncharacterized protein (TIGR02444 family)
MRVASEGNLPLDGPHWAFALDLYERPGVSEACLLLQDKAGVDITLLLFVLFVAKEHRTILDQADLVTLDASIAPWRDEVIQPLRSLRRRVKSGPFPAPSSSTEALRDRIKAAEVQAEQIELAVLSRWLERHQPQIEAEPVEIAAVLQHIAAFFASRANRPSDSRLPEIQAALDTLVRALSQPST